MKKRYLLSSFLLLAAPLMVFSFSTPKQTVKVEADSININDYSAADELYTNNDASGLLNELRRLTSPGRSGSYSALWSTFTSCYTKDDGYIKDYYSSISRYTSRNQDHGYEETQEGKVYNREHSIPKSWWGGSLDDGTQATDPFIVIPTDRVINERRSNSPYGMVSGTPSFVSAENYSKIGSSDSTWGFNGTVFEPNDDVKGDLARSTLYAIAKYSNSYSWTSTYGRYVFSGSPTNNFGLTSYAVKLLTFWNNLDKPDEWEIGLNNRLANRMHNRNPFIDHPEYVNVLWGDVSGMTQYTTVPELYISKTSISLFTRKNTTISGLNSDKSDTYWTIGDSAIASISSTTAKEITVTALKAGITTLTLHGTGEGGVALEKTCSVVVRDNVLERIEVKDPKTEYVVGEALVKPLVYAYYTNGSNRIVTNDCSFEGFTSNVAGEITVIVRYQGKETSYKVTVRARNGCGGNVYTTSILLSSLAFVGITIIFILSNKQKKKIY